MKRFTPLLLSLLLLPILSSCRFNLFPLIPEKAPDAISLPIRISKLTLVRQDKELVLNAQIIGDFKPGYLTVKWFNNFDPISEDNIYLDKDQRSATFKLPAPEKAAYRATLMFGEKVLRQVELYEIEP